MINILIKRSDFIMNNLRRKTLQDLYDIIANAKDNLDEVRDEEEC